MKKLFGLFLLAFAFLTPVGAEAACSGGNCFWTGGPCPAVGTAVRVRVGPQPAGREMNMWRNEGEQFGSAFNLTAQR
jgi:hypothetical protein